MKEITVKKESSRIWGKVRKGNLFLERALTHKCLIEIQKLNDRKK